MLLNIIPFLKLQIFFILVCSFSYAQSIKKDSAFYYFKKAQYYSNLNKHFEAYDYYIKAKNVYKVIEEHDSIAKCNLEIFNLINSQDNLDKDAKPYLDSYYQYVLKKQDSNSMLIAYYNFAKYYFDVNNKKNSSLYYRKVLLLSKKLNKKKTQASVYSNLALLYSKTSPDSASFFFNKALSFYSVKDKNQLLATYVNYANLLYQRGKFHQGIEQLKKAEKIIPTRYNLKYNKILFGKFANFYKETKNYKDAFYYHEKFNQLKDSLNITEQNIAISDLDKKYQTEKKEKENLKLKQDNLISEAQRKQNQNLFLGALVILFFSGIIYYQNLKSSKRKRLLAEQQKELEQQKNITLIKEQEIVTINAMVNGQEKERIRIAEDLHDNIGSVLATLKLHFENLKLNREKKHFNQDELYQKTEKLIDETYFKVRNLAHAKNAGVIANKGLLTAVKIMAEKISDANKIQIEVLDFGLEKRLENALELTVFRIIQELTTNIIKHAEAKNATINISAYDNNLNIIIEDNGKGFVFEVKELKADGIGLGSIQTRIEHLKGTFEVDSALGKGTTILMDIPV